MNNIIKSRYKVYSMAGLLCCITLLVSCSDWNEFEKYTVNGEIVYPGKFDSLVVFPGDNRVRIWGKLTTDPKVVKSKIFWNNGQDSAEFDIDLVASNYSLDQIIDVSEGVKSFTLYTYDAIGNKSVGSTVTGVAYGDRYRNTLSNRRIKSIAYEDAATTINWDIIDSKLGPEQMEVTYQKSGADTVIITPASETTTILPGLDYVNDGFIYRTIYRPLPSSNNVQPIDTFSTAFTAHNVPVFVEKELDRSLFSAAWFEGDTWANGGAGGVDAMWDDAPQNQYGDALFTSIDNGWTSPQMVTLNLGMNVKATALVFYPFQEWWGSYYVYSTIRDYEIYGSDNPNPNGALDESWTLLATGTFEKPSGSPKDNEDDADKATATAGWVVTVDPDAPKVRYIRIRCLKNYEGYWENNSAAFFSVAEIKVSGMLPE